MEKKTAILLAMVVTVSIAAGGFVYVLATSPSTSTKEVSTDNQLSVLGAQASTLPRLESPSPLASLKPSMKPSIKPKVVTPTPKPSPSAPPPSLSPSITPEPSPTTSPSPTPSPSPSESPIPSPSPS